MANQSIHQILETSMSKLRELVDANTVIGKEITTSDGTTIIPVSKVAFGFGSGGSDFSTKAPKDLFGGGAGGGVSVQPLGFLVIKDGEVKFVSMSGGDSLEKLTAAIPEAVDKISALFTKKDKKEDK